MLSGVPQFFMEINMGNLKTLSERIVDSAGTGRSDPEELSKLDGLGAIIASGTQAAKIADPAEGETVDAEARTAINAIIDALETFGISATE
jgi:hypothetical protein